jgi:hypothetical protein
MLTAATLNAAQLINNISKFILKPIIFLLFATAFLVFVWGVYNYVGGLSNEEARSKGGRHMLWGILGMFIMLSVKFLITIIASTIGVPSDQLPPDLR